MAEFIEILSPSALKDLTTANNEVVKLISNINSAGQAMQSIKTPSGSDSAVKNLSNNLIAQEKNIQKVQQALEKARIEEIKLQQAREKAFDKYDAQLAKEQAKLNASQNIYNKVQAKLNALSNEYKNLAVKKELSGKLTDAEAKRYDYLSGRITKYDNTLKAVDASMGKYQRNVGNYASAFNPLSNSINQLTREMPAFANSVQTGFMAISNNLPIFFDAIQSANAEIKALRANGEATPTLFQKLTSSILSWGTALSVGVTIMI
jgi:chromosome segregation ATPase